MLFSLCILIVTIWCSCGNNTVIPSDPVMERDMVSALGLKGNVLLLEEDHFTYSLNEPTDSVPDETLEKTRLRQFNPNGQLVREELSNDSRNTVTEYLLDVYGRYEEINCSAKMEEGGWYERFAYFDHGKLREKQRFNADERLEEREIYEYDDSLQLVKVTNRVYRYDREGDREEMTFVFSYQYDGNGNRVEERNGKVGASANVITYEGGKVVKKVQELVEGGIKVVQENSYDSAGRIQTSKLPDFSSGNACMQVYQYDSIGMLTEKRWAILGDHTEGNRITYQYDSLGLLIREIQSFGTWDSQDIEQASFEPGEDKPDRIVEYLYDSYGNWQSRIEYHGEEILAKVLRRITYQ